jgi:hypothetical protein
MRIVYAVIVTTVASVFFSNSVLSRSVETFKAAVRILYEILMYEICKNVLTIFNPYVQTLT